MLEYASFTAIGARAENQDRFLVLANETEGIHWFAISDGMGGHRGGALAAGAAITAIEQHWHDEKHSTTSPDLITRLILGAHDAVCALAENNETRPPQTTLAILVVSPAGAYSGHIGDTRVMLYNDAGLVKRTRDHSVTEMKHASGAISDSEMAADPEHNLITQALGGSQPLDIRLEQWDLHNGDLICLASDGAWSVVQAGEYMAMLTAPDLRVTTSEVLNARMKEAADNQDNATLLAIRKQAR